jgi:hypothetical protein
LYCQVETLLAQQEQLVVLAAAYLALLFEDNVSTKLEIGAACALVGASVFSIHQMYCSHAGSLNDVRTATPGDAATAERLRDADMLTGGLVAIVGGVLLGVTKRPEPLAIAAGAFLLTASYYHRTCNTSSVTGDY